jgi:hypothetical protein
MASNPTPRDEATGRNMLDAACDGEGFELRPCPFLDWLRETGQDEAADALQAQLKEHVAEFFRVERLTLILDSVDLTTVPVSNADNAEEVLRQARTLLDGLELVDVRLIYADGPQPNRSILVGVPTSRNGAYPEIDLARLLRHAFPRFDAFSIQSQDREYGDIYDLLDEMNDVPEDTADEAE